jgi:hypothetical protein
MKKPLYALLGLLITASILHAQTIAKWTFETSIPATAGPFAPEVGSGSALGWHSSSAAVYSNPAGNGSVESFSANTWSVGDYWQFEVSTLGFNNVGLSWDQTSSGTGPRDFSLEYSLDLGSSWTPVLSYSVLANASPNPVWNSSTYSPIYTFSPTLGGAVDNQASVWFRLADVSTVSANGSTVAAAGTDRVDNFTVGVIPEPASVSLMSSFGLLAWILIRRRK